MQKSTLYLAGLMLLTMSCATSLNGPDPAPYAPANSVDGVKTGAVSYNPHGLTELVEMRRKDALKRMYDACGQSNQYEIVSETMEKATDNNGSLANLGATEVKVLRYRCL